MENIELIEKQLKDNTWQIDKILEQEQEQLDKKSIRNIKNKCNNIKNQLQSLDIIKIELKNEYDIIIPPNYFSDVYDEEGIKKVVTEKEKLQVEECKIKIKSILDKIKNINLMKIDLSNKLFNYSKQLFEIDNI